jgi:hypothetical protein
VSTAAFKPEVLRAMARLFVESIFGLYRTRARRDGLMGGESGAVTFVQRFGGSLNLNVHMHVVVLDRSVSADRAVWLAVGRRTTSGSP